MRRVTTAVLLLFALVLATAAHAGGRGGGSGRGDDDDDDGRGGDDRGGDDDKGGNSGNSGMQLPPMSDKFAVGLNALQPLVFMLGTQFTLDEDGERTTLAVPIPIEVHAYAKQGWGVAGTFQILTYQQAPRTQLTELLLAVGPRYRFPRTGKKLLGVYATVKLGVGYWVGTDYDNDDYRRLGFVVQPEIGYAIKIGDPGLFLAFGVGLQGQLKLVDQPNRGEWTPLGRMLMGYTPWLNVTLGFGA